MTEKLAFEQVFTQGSAVDGYKGPVLAQTIVMYRPGDQFLTGAARTSENHRAVRGRTARNQAVDTLHLGTGADYILKAILGTHLTFQTDVFLQQPPALKCPGHHQLEFFGIKRLRQIIERTQFHGLNRRLDFVQAGDHDHIDIRL